MNSSSAILMRSLSLRRRAYVGTECAISSVWLASSEKPRRLSFRARNRVSDLVGEKLNETFVGRVLDSVLTEESRLSDACTDSN